MATAQDADAAKVAGVPHLTQPLPYDTLALSKRSIREQQSLLCKVAIVCGKSKIARNDSSDLLARDESRCTAATLRTNAGDDYIDTDDTSRRHAHFEQRCGARKALFVCKVDRTVTGHSRVQSNVRGFSVAISPTMMIFGSWRRSDRRPVAR